MICLPTKTELNVVLGIMFLKNVVLHEIYSKKSQKVTGQKVTDEKSQDKKSQFKFCILTKHI
jgi:hypothetical protein